VDTDKLRLLSMRPRQSLGEVISAAGRRPGLRRTGSSAQGARHSWSAMSGGVSSLRTDHGARMCAGPSRGRAFPPYALGESASARRGAAKTTLWRQLKKRSPNGVRRGHFAAPRSSFAQAARPAGLRHTYHLPLLAQGLPPRRFDIPQTWTRPPPIPTPAASEPRQWTGHRSLRLHGQTEPAKGVRKSGRRDSGRGDGGLRAEDSASVQGAPHDRGSEVWVAQLPGHGRKDREPHANCPKAGPERGDALCRSGREKAP